MDTEKGVMTILKWAGLLALLSIPIYLLTRALAEEQAQSGYDEDDIWGEELNA